MFASQPFWTKANELLATKLYTLDKVYLVVYLVVSSRSLGKAFGKTHCQNSTSPGRGRRNVRPMQAGISRDPYKLIC